MDSADAVRVAENEAMFRDINEDVVEAVDAALMTFLCECADEFCATYLDLTRADYEKVRAVAKHFVVAPEHVLPEVEVVVEEHPRYWVIRKIGSASQVAEETDPRSDN
jgi:hypothetical protein